MTSPLSLLWCMLVSVAYAGHVGVLVLPDSNEGTILKSSHLLSLRVMRRLEEVTGSQALVVSVSDYRSPDPVLEELKNLLARQTSDSDDALAFRMAQVVDEIAARPFHGPWIQKAALRLAVHSRRRPDELHKWIDTALRIHPALELEDGEEWDQGADYPEIGFQVTTERARLTRECDLRLGGAPAKMSLNGFEWAAPRILRSSGPYFLRIETDRGIFERWVSCGNEPVRPIFFPKELASDQILPIFSRHGLSTLVMGIVKRGVVRFFRVASTGEIRPLPLLSSRNPSLDELVELAATTLPFSWGSVRTSAQLTHTIIVKEPGDISSLPKTEPVVSEGIGSRHRVLWWGLGVIAAGTALKVSGLLGSSETSLSGTVE